MTEEKEDTLLIARDQYLAAGIHIGTQIKTQDMIPFIYRITRAGLYVIDIRQTDERMRIAAKFISRFDPERMVVVSARRYGHNPIQQFAHIVGGHAIPGRFVPGTLTNPNARSFLECDLLVIADPRADKQALREAKIAKIPVVSFCDTDNNLGSIDLCVPANNRGRKALALIFWLLTRQVLLEKGEIGRVEDFDVDVNRYQSRGLISYEPTGDRQKILSQLKEVVSEEEQEKPKDEITTEPEKVTEEKPEEKVEEKPAEEPVEKVEVEIPETKAPVEEKPAEEILDKKAPEVPAGDVVKPEDLIDGPLPEPKPKKAAKKKAKKKPKKEEKEKKAKKEEKEKKAKKEEKEKKAKKEEKEKKAKKEEKEKKDKKKKGKKAKSEEDTKPKDE